jgi:hypothetical protein
MDVNRIQIQSFSLYYGHGLLLLEGELLVLLVVGHFSFRDVVIDGQTWRVEALNGNLSHFAYIYFLKNEGEESIGASHDILHQILV